MLQLAVLIAWIWMQQGAAIKPSISDIESSGATKALYL
jgi:hypothetical protein